MEKSRKKWMAGIGIGVVCIVALIVGIRHYCANKADSVLAGMETEDDIVCKNGFQYMKTGMLYCSGDFIRFCDNESGQDGLICTDKNCSHGKGSKSECGARINAGVCGGVIKRGDSLYYIADEESGDMGKCFLFSANLEGKDRKKLAELTQMDLISDVICHDNKIYISYKETPFDEKAEEAAGVYVYDLESGKGKKLFYLKGTNTDIYGMVFGEKDLYVSYAYSTASKEEILENRTDETFEETHRKMLVTRIDVTTGEQIKSFEGHAGNSTLLYVDGKVFYSVDQKPCYYDEKTKVTEKIESQELLPVYSNSQKYVYYTGYDSETQEAVYYRYDVKKKALEKMGTGDFIPSAVIDGTVYLLETDEKGDDHYGFADVGIFKKKDTSSKTIYESVWKEE